MHFCKIMKKTYFLLFALFTLPIVVTAQENAASAEAIEWLTWDEAIKRNATAPKKFMIDVYTDWCGWCKHMDKTTFRDEATVKYIREHFYAIKLDAEQKSEIVFNNYTFKYLDPNNTGRGVHELAYSLLDGKLGYPSIVYLTPQYQRILISPGFKAPDAMLKELKFTAEDKYSTMSWEAYQQSGGK
jgi:thioredoxin-related protein